MKTLVKAPFLITGVSLFLIFFSSCKSNRERVTEIIAPKVDSIIAPNAAFLIETMPFLCCKTEDFWYTEQTTEQEIIDDDFNKGYDNLTRLENIVGKINPSYNEHVKKRVESLNGAINETKTAIRKYRNMKNDLFSSLILSNAMALGSFLSLGEDNVKEEKTEMPSKIAEAMIDLQGALISYRYSLKLSLLNVEKICIEDCNYPYLEDQDRIKIRQCLSSCITNKFISMVPAETENSCQNRDVNIFSDLPNVGLSSTGLSEKVDHLFSKVNLNELSSKTIKTLKNAVIYDYSTFDDIYTNTRKDKIRDRFNFDSIQVFNYNEQTQIIQVTSNRFSFYLVEGKIVKILTIEPDYDSTEFFEKYDIDHIDPFYYKIDNINAKKIIACAYKSNDDVNHPSYYVLFDFHLLGNKILINTPQILQYLKNNQ